MATPEGRRTRYEISDRHLTRGIRHLLDAVVAVDEGTPCADDACECCESIGSLDSVVTGVTR